MINDSAEFCELVSVHGKVRLIAGIVALSPKGTTQLMDEKLIHMVYLGAVHPLKVLEKGMIIYAYYTLLHNAAECYTRQCHMDRIVECKSRRMAC
ncbi:MAG: hypothetical protein H6937_10335 [Burkholderiales bacterium]|nr:hypothetical protein [Burkholderiales bacterium]MDR4517996.1 hypothetical protein [Nitrosomonas sp.]